ncbi:MAG: hypothetical protein HGJ94_16855 [Desulfosarcina sp.]|nr:hypothetical protein [Desulfosarcina sp.]MBC2744269.1 hypothetical protein [Desulfosarcina sp.]MBC2767178.1 hypothetical protein [Desulfosarcina sp.]
MKKLALFLTISATMVLANAGPATEGLTTIGTLNYLGSDYNLIYEDDNNGHGLVWMDYTNGFGTWEIQMDWAAGLNNAGVLTVSFNPGLAITGEGDWRLPSAGDNPDYGYNQPTSKMGHLNYTSLGDTAGPGVFTSSAPFENLHPNPKSFYWTGTELSLLSDDYAWGFQFEYGSTGYGPTWGLGYSLAVLPGDVTVVPIPVAVWLLGFGLIGVVGFRRRNKW